MAGDFHCSSKLSFKRTQQTIVVLELSLPRLLMLMRVKGGLKRGFQLCVLVENTKLSAGHCHSIAVLEGVGRVPSTGAHVACPNRVHTSCNAASCCSCSVPCPMVPNSKDKQKALNLLPH